MIFFLAVLLIIIFIGIRISGPGEFNTSYLDKRNTAAINGIFVVLVVFSHYSHYADFGGVLDAPYLWLQNHLHQMVVATFLFYSGYGMMEQIKKKGNAYIYGLPEKTGKLLFRFDMAILLYLLMKKIVFGKTYSLERIVLSMIGWKAVGNSNWYIFDILVLYVLMFAAFGLASLLTRSSRPDGAGAKEGFFRKHPYLPGLVLFFILTLAFIYVMMKAERGTRWYNTVILLPAGCLYSQFREKIERLIMKNDVSYYLALLIGFAVYCVTYLHRRSYGIEGYTVWALSFLALGVLVTMKVSVHNDILEWLGRHVFSIYILQRMPMLIFDHFGLIDDHKYLCLIAVFVITIPFAFIFDKATDRMLLLLSAKHKS